MDYIVAVVNKYKERLAPHNDFKKILRALQKLNEVEMTIDILQKTEVGKAVNKLKKMDGVGSFAREIVLKWKRLLQVPCYDSSSKTISYNGSNKNKNEEYDPTQNWEMQTKMEKSYKVSQVESEEYDPTQNWQMKKKSSSSKHSRKQCPSPSPPIEVYNSHQKENYSESTSGDDVNMEEESSPPASDADYPSSAEDEDTSSLSNNSSHDIYAPSVTSRTLYTNDNTSVAKTLDSRSITDNFKKAKTIHSSKSEKKSDRKIHQNTSKLKVRNHAESDGHKEKSKEKSLKRPKVLDSKSLTQSSSSSAVKLKQPSSSNNTRLAEEMPPSKKSRKEDPVRVNQTKSKSKLKNGKKENSNSKSSSLSFEQFMMMDTSAVKKKKKKVKPDKQASPSEAKPSSSTKPKVQLQLPQIKSIYRPLPTNPAQADSKRASQKSAVMTDEVAAALHTQRSSKKMQVYSGQKTNYLPKMLSLYDQCMNVLLNNIDKLDVIGVPYDIIRPVLIRCTVEQLYRLEDANPYLLEDTGELWEKHAQQDFRSEEPTEMESWREMYLRLYDAREEKLARLTHTIQAKVNKSKPLEKRTKLAYVGIGEAKAPRNVLRAQMKFGTAGKKPIPYQPSMKSKGSSSSSASSFKQQVSEIRLSVPPGTITADSVDGMGNGRFGANKRQPPKIAPMMAKTLKSIKLRHRR